MCVRSSFADPNSLNVLVMPGKKLTKKDDIKEKSAHQIYAGLEHYRSVFENSITAIFITRPDGSILEANRAACRLFGYTEEEFRKLGRQGVIDSKSPGLSEKLMEREKKGSTSGELIGIRKTGEKFWCEFSSVIFDDSDGVKMASVMLNDISDKKEVQERRKEQISLYNIAKLNENELPIDELLHESVKILKQGYISPKFTGIRITYMGKDYSSDFFDESNKKITTQSTKPDDNKLKIEAVIQDKKETKNIHFIEEEIELTDAVADLLSLKLSQKETRLELEKSNERFKYINQVTQEVIYEHDFEKDEIILSKNFESVFGYTFADEEFTLELWEKSLHPEDREEINRRLEKTLEDKNANKWIAEFRYKKKDGSYVYVLENSYIIRDNTGKVVRMIGSIKDISDQKLKELQKSLSSDVSISFTQADNLKDALNSTLTHIAGLKSFDLAEFWLSDRDNKQLHLIAHHDAPGVSNIFHPESEEALLFKKGIGLPGYAWKKKTPVFWRNLDKRKSFTRYKKAKAAGLKTGFAYPVVESDDVIGVLVLAVKEDLKTKPYYFSLFSELALQLASEIKRKQLGEELSRIFNSAPDVICIAGLDGYYKKVNPAMSNLLGYSEEELLTTPIVDFVHPADKQKTRKEFEALNKGKGNHYFENRHITKSGKVIWLSWTTKPFYDEEITYSVAKDITEEKGLRELLDQANRLAKIGSWEVDLINDKVYWSDIIREIHEVDPGFSLDLETRINFYKEGESRDKFRKAVNRAIQHGESWDLELELVTVKGNERWVRTIGEVDIVDGTPIRIYGSFQDIHSRKIAELKLQERTRHINAIASLNSALLNYENWYEALETHLAEIGEAVLSDRVYYFENRFDAETGEGYTSQKLEWCKAGIKPQLNNPDLEDIPFKEAPELINPMIKGHPSMVSLSEVDEGTVTRYVMEGQDIKTFLAIPVYLQDTFYGFVGFDNCTVEKKWSDEEIRMLKTITSNLAVAIERNQTEKERKELLDEKNRILESISDAFYALDENWTITYFNNEAERLLGKSAKHVIGKSLWEEFAPARQTELHNVYKDVLDFKKPISFEYHYPPLDAWFDISAYPAGAGISVYFKNIDDKKEAREKILQKTRELDAIATFNSLLIKKGSWHEALIESLQIFGEVTQTDRVYFFENYLDEETGDYFTTMKFEWVTGSVSREINNPEHQNVPFDFLKEFIKPLKLNLPYNNQVEKIEDDVFRMLLKSQDIKSVLAVPVFVNQDFRGFIGFDDCKRERNWKSEEISFLQTIALNLASAIENEDAETALQKAFEEKNEILESIGDGFFAVNQNFIVEYWNNKAEDLLLTPKEKILNQNLWDVFDKNLAQVSFQQYSIALKEHTDLKFEDYYEPIGRWFDVNVYPSANGISVFFKDITERKKADEYLKELNQTLEQQTKKLAASNTELEQFAFVASHDLQEPLRMVTSFLTRLEKKYGDQLDEKAKTYIDFAVDGAKRMRQIILDLLQFSRVGKSDEVRSKVDINKIIDDYCKLRIKLIDDKSAKIIKDDLPVLTINKTPIIQVFHNLLDNALYYSKEDEPPVVHIQCREKDQEWEFSIRDNGIGIPEEYFNKIFMIFQRLNEKTKSGGTGLGLAIVKKSLDSLEGRIWVESILDEGSTFYFTIPKRNIYMKTVHHQ
ncbi:MAG: PAS domain S-box protein [Balneolaceae bacterium]|nr:MAG: PAS domain S-box protein [Balneolaceae bacterium]